MNPRRRLLNMVIFFSALTITVGTMYQTIKTNAQTINSIVINEVAWKGSAASSNDEYIELYNPTTSSVDLTGYTLEVVGKTPITLSGTIESAGYYLLERQDNNTVKNITASLVYPYAVSLKNCTSNCKVGDDIILRNSGQEIIDYLPFSAGWPFYIAGYQTMERHNPFGVGYSASNWAMNDSQVTNGLDANSNPLLGTPGQLNSVTRTLFNSGYAPEPAEVASIQNLTAVQSGAEIAVTWDSPSELLNITIDIIETLETIEMGVVAGFYYEPTLGSGTYTFRVSTNNGAGAAGPQQETSVSYEGPQPITIAESVLINEFNSLPEAGEKEWIELYNSLETWVSLNECTISDSSAVIHTFTSTDAIEAKGHNVAELSTNKLHDDTDKIILNCSSQIIDEIEYGKHGDVESYFSFTGAYPESLGFIPHPISSTTTAGRTPDGGSDWARFNKELQNTKGSANLDLRPIPGVENLSGRAVGSNIILEWTNPESTSATGIRIYQVDEDEGTKELLSTLSTNETQAVLAGFGDIKTYGFQVAPFNEGGSEVEETVYLTTTGILINEVVPNPRSTQTQMIELYNASTETIDVYSYKLRIYNGVSLEGVKLPLTELFDYFEINTQIEAGKYLSFDPENIYEVSLNTTNGSLELLNTEEASIDTLGYAYTIKGGSMGYNDAFEREDYYHPTPGTHNEIHNEPPVAAILVQDSGLVQGCTELVFNPAGKDPKNIVKVSTDPDEDDLTYVWEYHDSQGGLLYTYSGDENNKNGDNPKSYTFILAQGELFTVTLTVTDPLLASNTTSLQIELNKNCGGRSRVTDTAASQSYATTLIITEILPDPEGADSENEMIELYNSGSTTVNLSGWKINDGSNHTIPNVTIGPKQYLALTAKQMTLRFVNGGTAVKLLDPNGSVVSQVTYPKAVPFKSYAKKEDGSFAWTLPTPDVKNDFPLDQPIVYVQQQAKIVISRFLANPEGTDKGNEWIEIKNTSEMPISLQNWKLDNRSGSSKPFIIGAVTLSPGQTRSFSDTQTGITLRNSGDQIRLFAPNGQLMDQLEWSTPVGSGTIVTREALLKGEVFMPDTATVTHVVDGDTLDVRMPDGTTERIRLLGVDTPETVHPQKKVEFFGKEASNYTKSKLTGQNITLEYDLTKRGKYGRLLAYIHLNGQSFNEDLVRNGYAFAYLIFPFRYREHYRQLEEEARLNYRGMWATLGPEEIKELKESETDEELKEFESIEAELEKLEEKEKEEEEVQEEEKEDPSIPDQTGWENIRLSEMMPNPKGRDEEGGEFIELINIGQLPINLTQWTFIDHTKKTIYTFSDQVIEPNDYLIVTKLNKALKNSNATFTLLDPLGQQRDTTSYTVSMKDDTSWAKHPLTNTWMVMSTPTPGGPNPAQLTTSGPDTDRDGISDEIENLLGLSLTSFDSDSDGYSDDFELTHGTDPMARTENLDQSYQEYLAEKLTVETRLSPTGRSLVIFGKALPYTTVRLTIRSDPKIILVPVNTNGTWTYRVDFYLESEKHSVEAQAVDPNQRVSPLKAPVTVTLVRALNVSKAPKQAKSSTAKKPSFTAPLYTIIHKPKQLLSATVLTFNCEQEDCQISLDDGRSLRLETNKYPPQLLRTVLSPNTPIRYAAAPDLHTIEQFELIPKARANNESTEKPASKRDPLIVLLIISAGLIVFHIVTERKNRGSRQE